MNRATRDKFASATDQSDLTAGNSCWETAPAIFAKLQEEYGFDVDLTADAQRALLPVWFGPGSPHAEDALLAPWTQYGTFGYSNPPYGAFIPKILRKAEAEASDGFSSLFVLPLRLTRGFRASVFHSHSVSEWLHPDKRLTFFENGEPRRDAKGTPTTAMFDSTILILRPGYFEYPRIAEWRVPDHVPAEFKRRKRAA